MNLLHPQRLVVPILYSYPKPAPNSRIQVNCKLLRCNRLTGSSQAHAGAFGQTSAKRITETGSPGGNLSDHMPHPSILAATFCIPPTNNPAVDGVADLPGPGAFSLNGNAQLNP